jgi:hypothetical protein
MRDRRLTGSVFRLPPRYRRHGPGSGAAVATIAIAVAIAISIAGCAGTERSSLCGAYNTLRDAVGVLNDAAGEDGELGPRIDEVDASIRSARRQLSGEGANPSTAPAARAMVEASNYLEFMVGQYRDEGAVDFSLTQFASRELTRALSGAGGRPLNC